MSGNFFATDYAGDSLICPKNKFSNFIWIDFLCVTTGITEKGRKGAGKTGCGVHDYLKHWVERLEMQRVWERLKREAQPL